MGFQIEDGKGRGLLASVSSTNRLNASAKTNPRIFYSSRDDGQAFTVTSLGASIVAGEHSIYLKNDSTTRNLFVRAIHISNVEDVLWKIWSVTGTASAGNALTPSNLNLGSGLSAEATVRGDDGIADLTTDRLLKAMRVGALEHADMHYDDSLMLTTGTAIALEYDTGTTGNAEVTIEFHYEEIGAN
jgi:hypothetical protein